jgi:hypothetical protein
VRLDTVSGCRAKPGPQCRIGQQPADGAAQFANIARRDK